MKWVDLLDWSEEQVIELRQVGEGYLQQGLFRRAVIFFEALIALDGETVYDYQVLGAILLELNQPKKALVYFDQALDLEPKELTTHVNKSKALLLLGEREEGLALAHSLTDSEDLFIADRASALVMAYG